VVAEEEEEGWLVSWIGAGVEENGRSVFRIMSRVTVSYGDVFE
jgi:hypothetical protein